MRNILAVALLLLIAVIVFVLGFRTGRLYSTSPLRIRVDPTDIYNGRNLKVELIQVRNVHNNQVACTTDGHQYFHARADNMCYLADASKHW